MTVKFALITGSSRGLGAHLSRRFWDAGYSLIMVSRMRADIQLVIDTLPMSAGQIAIPMTCDLATVKDVLALVQHVTNSVTRLDVLVNNAAMQGPIGPLCENDGSAWHQTIQVNLFAPVLLCQGLIPLIRKSGSGSIINLSGGGATGPRANFSAYATAKAGLVRFSESIADELKMDGIRVNCIAPGAMKTAMLQEVLNVGDAAGSIEKSLASDVLAKGGASMDRVADLALFLASSVSNGISGKLISAVWDNWEQWPENINQLSQSDVYTLRRITGRDRGFEWGDK